MFWRDYIWFDDLVWYDLDWFDLIWSALIWFDLIWSHLMWFDLIWTHLIWFDLIWSDLIWFDLIWSDLIWFDLIWSDLIWFDLILIIHCYRDVYQLEKMDKMDFIQISELINKFNAPWNQPILGEFWNLQPILAKNRSGQFWKRILKVLSTLTTFLELHDFWILLKLVTVVFINSVPYIYFQTL